MRARSDYVSSAVDRGYCAPKASAQRYLWRRVGLAALYVGSPTRGVRVMEPTLGPYMWLTSQRTKRSQAPPLVSQGRGFEALGTRWALPCDPCHRTPERRRTFL